MSGIEAFTAPALSGPWAPLATDRDAPPTWTDNDPGGYGEAHVKTLAIPAGVRDQLQGTFLKLVGPSRPVFLGRIESKPLPDGEVMAYGHQTWLDDLVWQAGLAGSGAYTHDFGDGPGATVYQPMYGQGTYLETCMAAFQMFSGHNTATSGSDVFQTDLKNGINCSFKDWIELPLATTYQADFYIPIGATTKASFAFGVNITGCTGTVSVSIGPARHLATPDPTTLDAYQMTGVASALPWTWGTNYTGTAALNLVDTIPFDGIWVSVKYLTNADFLYAGGPNISITPAPGIFGVVGTDGATIVGGDTLGASDVITDLWSRVPAAISDGTEVWTEIETNDSTSGSSVMGLSSTPAAFGTITTTHQTVQIAIDTAAPHGVRLGVYSGSTLVYQEDIPNAAGYGAYPRSSLFSLTPGTYTLELSGFGGVGYGAFYKSSGGVANRKVFEQFNRAAVNLSFIQDDATDLGRFIMGATDKFNDTIAKVLGYTDARYGCWYRLVGGEWACVPVYEDHTTTPDYEATEDLRADGSSGGVSASLQPGGIKDMCSMTRTEYKAPDGTTLYLDTPDADATHLLTQRGITRVRTASADTDLDTAAAQAGATSNATYGRSSMPGTVTVTRSILSMAGGVVEPCDIQTGMNLLLHSARYGEVLDRIVSVDHEGRSKAMLTLASNPFSPKRLKRALRKGSIGSGGQVAGLA
jgi:hypothetical protein